MKTSTKPVFGLAFHLSRLYNRCMNEAFHLSRLQKIDTQLDHIATRLAEIDRQLAENAAVRAAEAQVEAANRALESARRNLRSAEEAVQAQRVKIELNEKSLYGGKVRNPKELQDLQNESAALKRHLSILEDQQLEMMLALEDTEKNQTAAAENLHQVQGQQAGLLATAMGDQTRLQREKTRLLAERAPLTAQVAASALELYERLRKQKRGLAVAGIEEGSCTACGSELTPAEWQSARNPNTIINCSSCGRILYAG
ncbi:MAG TPA: C4-type zinc ribbon domain-containing protein [Anaerolineaceae bacterium]|nr:C4-type zinc ribbon domain-containing protein [Anaerolineaceae bacterium]